MNSQASNTPTPTPGLTVSERWRLAMPDVLPVQVSSLMGRAYRGEQSVAAAQADAEEWVVIALTVGCSEIDVRRWVAEGLALHALFTDPRLTVGKWGDA